MRTGSWALLPLNTNLCSVDTKVDKEVWLCLISAQWSMAQAAAAAAAQGGAAAARWRW